MCSDFSFLIGLILLIKGDFRLQSRYVPKHRGRLIGLVLMVPTVVSICVVANIGYGRLASLSVSEAENLTFEMMQNVLIDVLPQVATLQMLLLAAALVTSAYLILSLPRDAMRPAAAPAWGVRPAAPPTSYAKVLTTAEVADYLRIPEFEVITLIEDGKLPAARIGSDYRIARSAVEDFLQASGREL